MIRGIISDLVRNLIDLHIGAVQQFQGFCHTKLFNHFREVLSAVLLDQCAQMRLAVMKSRGQGGKGNGLVVFLDILQYMCKFPDLPERYSGAGYVPRTAADA